MKKSAVYGLKMHALPLGRPPIDKADREARILAHQTRIAALGEVPAKQQGHLTPETKRTILEAHQAGLCGNQIARELQLCKSTVNRFLAGRTFVGVCH